MTTPTDDPYAATRAALAEIKKATTPTELRLYDECTRLLADVDRLREKLQRLDDKVVFYEGVIRDARRALAGTEE